MTLSTRLTLWYSLVLCAVLAITGAAVFAEHRRLELGFLDRDLATYADSVTRIVNDDLDDGVSISAAAHHAIRELSFPGRMLVILDAKGQPLVSTTPGGIALPISDGEVSTGSAQGTWRMVRLTVRRGLEQYAVVAGDPLGAFRQRALRLQRAFFVGVPVAVVLAALGGWWLVRVGLRPAGLLAAQAEHASEAQRVRLDVPDPSDEFGRLATSFNGLLERLDRARDAERQLMADASHELRTPVSIARTAAEVTLSQPARTEQEYRESLGIIAEQARRLAQMVDGMFVLARADAGGQTLVVDEFYLDELAHECVRGVSVVARTRQVEASCAATEDLQYRGDEGLVRRLMVNLLQNAVEHAPSGGHVASGRRKPRRIHRHPGHRQRAGDPGGRSRARLRPVRPPARRDAYTRRWARAADRALDCRSARRTARPRDRRSGLHGFRSRPAVECDRPRTAATSGLSGASTSGTLPCPARCEAAVRRSDGTDERRLDAA